MSAPRVLFVSGLQVHPTVSGGTLRSYALARALGRRGFAVRIHSLTGRKADYLAGRPSSVDRWPCGIAERVERGPLSLMDWAGGFVLGLPPLWLTARREAAVASGLLSRALRDGLAWCDVIVADFPYLAPVLRARGARGKLRVLSTHNVEHHLASGAGIRARMVRAVVREVERSAARACDVLVACCADDARAFDALAGRDAIVVPNGVERDRFRLAAGVRARTRAALEVADGETMFLFSGSKWGPNRAALDALVAMARTCGRALAAEGIHVVAVGSMGAEPMRLPALTVTGRVERVEPFFAAADAALNPVAAGAGTNLKTCEFIAAGLPLLTTSFGARGFRLEDGRSAFLFHPDDLPAALVRMRRSFVLEPSRPRELAARAFAVNADVVDMDACAGPLADALFARVARRRTRPAEAGGTALPQPV